MVRLLLTLATLALAVGVYALMLKGWRGRRGRQLDLPPPPVSSGDSLVLAGPVPGLFVGTTGAESWLDCVVVHRLSDRATANLVVAEDGVHVQRQRLPELFLPWSCVDSVQVESALGGKVVRTGMLLLTWRLGGQRLRTAFRADRRDDHVALREAITARLTVEAL